MSAVAIIRRALELLPSAEHWVPGYSNLDERGAEVGYREGARHSTIGAIIVAAAGHSPNSAEWLAASSALKAAAAEQSDDADVHAVGEKGGYPAARKMLARALELAEGEVAQ